MQPTKVRFTFCRNDTQRESGSWTFRGRELQGDYRGTPSRDYHPPLRRLNDCAASIASIFTGQVLVELLLGQSRSLAITGLLCSSFSLLDVNGDATISRIFNLDNPPDDLCGSHRHPWEALAFRCESPIRSITRSQPNACGPLALQHPTLPIEVLPDQ